MLLRVLLLFTEDAVKQATEDEDQRQGQMHSPVGHFCSNPELLLEGRGIWVNIPWNVFPML